MNESEKAFAALILIVLAVIVIIFSPLVCIWALNALFALAIPYTFITWIAMFILIALFGKTSVKVNKK
jgi:hypothetical protein